MVKSLESIPPAMRTNNYGSTLTHDKRSGPYWTGFGETVLYKWVIQVQTGPELEIRDFHCSILKELKRLLRWSFFKLTYCYTLPKCSRFSQ